jgi:transcription elongation factor GreA
VKSLILRSHGLYHSAYQIDTGSVVAVIGIPVYKIAARRAHLAAHPSLHDARSRIRQTVRFCALRPARKILYNSDVNGNVSGALRKESTSGRKVHPTRGSRSRTKKNKMADVAERLKKKLQEEIALLDHELHTDLPKELMKARAHGDLKENAEYKYAKERQSFVSARLGQLHARMAEISMLNLENLPRDRAAYGSTVRLLDIKKSQETQYKLVTAAKGLISTSSPIGRALLGKKAGDEVQVQTPAGVKEFEVVHLLTIHDDV